MSNIKKIDAKDWICPLPVLRTMKYLKTMKKDDILEVEVNNNKSISELQKYCDETGHILKSITTFKNNHLIKIQKR